MIIIIAVLKDNVAEWEDMSRNQRMDYAQQVVASARTMDFEGVGLSEEEVAPNP